MTYLRYFLLFATFLLVTLFVPPLLQSSPLRAQSTSATQRLFLPVIFRNYQPTPLYATSIYVQNEYALYNLGCELGQRDRNLPGAQDSLVVLNFGQGWFKDGTTLNQPGTGLFSPYWHFIPIATIENAVKNYIQGYWVCSAEDQASQVMVAVGTNNYGSYGTSSTNLDTRRNAAYAHGKAWAQMIVRLWQWVKNSGYASQIAVASAIDIEWGDSTTRWNTPYVTYG